MSDNYRNKSKRSVVVRVIDGVAVFLFDTLASFRPPTFVALNEFRQIARLLGHPHKLVLEKVLCRRTL